MLKKRTLAEVALISSMLVVPFILATTTYADTCPHVWSSNLKIGSVGDDVRALQQFLNSDPATIVATAGPGSSGNESSNFGGLTAHAVAAFQEKYAADILVPNGLSSGTGIVGNSTRAKLNALCEMKPGSANVPSTVASSTQAINATNTLTVTAADQPSATLAPSFALYVPFTNITLAAGSSDVTVNSITIERIGPSSDQMFADADLFDGDGNFITYTYFKSNHMLTFLHPITIPAGTSETLSIVGDMNDLTGHGGEIAGLQVDSIDASAPVVGSFPIRGTFQTLNDTLSIGEAFATLSGDDPMTDTTHYINDTGVRFSGIRVTAGSEEDIRLNSITWDQAGTASPSDIQNVRTVVNGTSYPAEVDGRSYTSVFPGGITVTKGNSVDLAVLGDLTTTGSYRTAKFDLKYGTDLDITGLSYGYGIALVPSGNTDVSGNSVFLTTDGTPDGDSLQPFFSGSVVSIQGGALIGIGK